MRGKWNLTDWEKTYWPGFFERQIAKLKAGYIKEIDLTREDLCPENVIDALKILGYEDDDMDVNGWEQDTEIFLVKEDDVGLVLSYCGRTFKMDVRLMEDEE